MGLFTEDVTGKQTGATSSTPSLLPAGQQTLDLLMPQIRNYLSRSRPGSNFLSDQSQFDVAGDYARALGPGGSIRSAQGVLDFITKGGFRPENNPELFNTQYRAATAPLLDQWTRSIVPGLNSEAAKGGAFFSGGRNALFDNATKNLTTSLGDTAEKLFAGLEVPAEAQQYQAALGAPAAAAQGSTYAGMTAAQLGKILGLEFTPAQGGLEFLKALPYGSQGTTATSTTGQYPWAGDALAAIGTALGLSPLAIKAFKALFPGGDKSVEPTTSEWDAWLRGGGTGPAPTAPDFGGGGDWGDWNVAPDLGSNFDWSNYDWGGYT